MVGASEAAARQPSKIGLGEARPVQSSTCRSECVGFQSINQSFNIYMGSFKIHTQRRSTFFLLQGFLSSMSTKSLNPSSVLFKIQNSNNYGNGVPTAKISVGTPFTVVPIGNEPCSKPPQMEVGRAGKISHLFIKGKRAVEDYAMVSTFEHRDERQKREIPL